MPDQTPAELEATGLRAIGRELAAGFADELSKIKGILRLSKEADETPSEEAAEKEAEGKEADKADGKAAETGEAKGDGEEAGYDDLNKGANVEAAVDVTEFLDGMKAGLQDLIKGVADLGSKHDALVSELNTARADIQALRADNEHLKTAVTAGNLALAKLGDSIVDPLVKAVVTRPEGVPAGTPAANPAGAAARMGTAGPAPVEYGEADLAKAVEAGVVTPDQHVKYKFRRVFSDDPATDAQIRTNLNATLKA